MKKQYTPEQTALLNEGAEMERKAVVAKIRRELKRPAGNDESGLDALLTWMQERTVRNRKRAGGLGPAKKHNR